MKRYSVFFIAIVVVLSSLSAILYTSCQKNPTCSKVCLNGSSCANGSCRCLSGYYGEQCQFGKIVYRNNTPTSVKLTVKVVHGTSDVSVKDTIMYIPGYTTADFYGVPGSATVHGDTAVATAYTFGPFGPTGSVHDVVFGETVSWNVSRSGFTTNGTVFVDLSVRPDYFFLQVRNQNVPPQGNLNVASISVNNGLFDVKDTIQNTPGAIPLYYGGNFTVVNDSLIHNVGYFGSGVASTVATTDVTGYVITQFCHLPLTYNQVFVMTIP